MGARILKVLQELIVIESQQVPRFQALDKMKQCSGRYDPNVLDAVANSFGVCLKPDSPKETTRRAIAFKDLRIGDLLRSDITTNDETLIVTAGTEVSQLVMEKLRNFAELSGIKEPIHIEG